MAGRKRSTAGQRSLPGTSGRYSPGTVERAVRADMVELAELGLLAPGARSLTDAYRLCAREIDRAEREQDRWGKIGAARELRQLRQVLAPIAPLPAGDEGLEALLDRIAVPSDRDAEV